MDSTLHLRDDEVRAVLAGTMTRFRAKLSPHPIVDPDDPAVTWWPTGPKGPNRWEAYRVNERAVRSLRWWFRLDQIIGVKESWRADESVPKETIYRADCPEDAVRETRGLIRWRNPLHMPHSRIRITVRVTKVAVEFVGDTWWYVVDFARVTP